MATLTNLMDSFFDDDNPKAGFDFVSPNSTHQKDLDFSATLASNLTCSNSDAGFSKQGIFALHGNLIVLYQSEAPHSPSLVLNLLHSRLKPLGSGELNTNYGFQVIKNGASFEFYSSNKQSIESWVRSLKNICILCNFHDEYMANKTLGVGGFATVCLVESRKTRKFYAVKAFSKRGMQDSTRDKAKPALLNEILMMRDLNNSNIVKLYEVYETENSIYLVMELIRGKTLYEILRKSELRDDMSESKIRNMMYSILSALAHIASQGIMHRDLKPANILVSKDDVIKIADFGLATYVKAENYVFKKCGTPGYIAPEIYKYDQKDPLTYYDDRCDMFSAGCIFFYMLFGYAFFKGCDASEVVKLNQNFNMNYENVWVVKKELKNPHSKIDKEALQLLLQLIELDPNIRITASQALSHPYFRSKRQYRKGSSANGLEDYTESKPTTSLLEPLSAGTKPRHFTFNLKDDIQTPGSFIAVGLNKITEKDSLYLDISRSESNGKSSEGINGISLHSPLLNKNDSVGVGSNPNSLSAFANPQNTLKTNTIKNPQNGPSQHGSKILRAAIFNSMQKNEKMSEPVQKGKSLRIKYGRHNTDYVLPEFHLLNGSEETKAADESCEVDEGGNEHAEIQKNVDHVQNFAKKMLMLPSKKAHVVK